MADLLEKRKALHQRVGEWQEKCRALEDVVAQLQPLANLGMAWAMTAHELNNLLMPVINYSQMALQNPEDAPLSEKALQKSLLLSERAATILEKIMMLANQGPVEKEKHDLNVVLDNVFLCIGRDFEKDKIRVVRDIAENIQITADLIAIQQVFMNLILNARDAMLENGGRLTISAEETAEGTSIQISDTGRGIEPAMLEKIFTPFYTCGKDRGNGLGLAFCQKVIEAHSGFIAVDSKSDCGTHFKILLPTYTI